jgi:hypothetical protein
VDPDSESGSGSRRAKMTHKSRRKIAEVHVLKCWMTSLRAEGFLYNLDIIYGGLGIGKLQFLIIKKKIFSCNFFSNFWSYKALDPDPEKRNTDPQPCLKIVPKPTSTFCPGFPLLSWVDFVVHIHSQLSQQLLTVDFGKPEQVP